MVVQGVEQLRERLRSRPQEARGICAVEKHADLTGDLVEEALEVETVAAIGQAGEPRGKPQAAILTKAG